MLIEFAIALTSMSAMTGILAVGSGKHWAFTGGDYFRGKRNAIVYLWVICSAIFSICHSGALVQYGLESNWKLHSPSDVKWMVIHGTTGLLLSIAHLFVRSTLSKEIGPVDKYLWGAKSRALS